MKRQHIVVAYLKNQSDLTQTARKPVPFSAYTVLLSAYKRSKYMQITT